MKSLLLVLLSFMGRKLRRTPIARSTFLNRIFAELSLWLYGSRGRDVGPFHVRFDPRDRVLAKKLALYGEFERHEIALLCALIEPGDHVLDIGANIGLYSLFLSRAVGPTGWVGAVEPDPDNLALLRSNLEANRCTNVIVLPYAFGAESGCVDLFQVEHNRGQLSLADVHSTGRSIRVQMRRGEDALAELPLRPRAAKIDVEGAEPLVLSGLGTYKPRILLFEFVPQLLRASGHNPAAFLDSLVAEGYTLELIDPDSGERIRSEPATIMAITEVDNLDHNILAIR
jgi:FkbM family methyltransferase